MERNMHASQYVVGGVAASTADPALEAEVPHARNAPGPTEAAARSSAANTDVLAIRFAARLVDALIALPFLPLLLIPVLGPLVFAAGHTAYFVVCESLYGATLGKRLFNLQVRDAEGSPLDARGAILRNSFLLLGLVPFVGPFLSLAAHFVIGIGIGLAADCRGPHDKFGQASVVRPSA